MNVSSTAPEATQCSNPDCKVAESGKCVEGHELPACANYGKPLQLIEPDTEEDDEAPDADLVELLGADKLTIATTKLVLRRDYSRVIAIVGPHDAGKTSLVAGLYDLFQAGPVSGAFFRGSLTLHAFEMACHDARAASERGTPHINRTPYGEVQFYHLALRRMASGEAISLVLADRAGEYYRSAADDVSVVAEFVEVHRADTVVLLVDGERLADSKTRHNVRAEIILLIQALKDGAGLTNGQRLAVVLTKLDAVNSSANRERVLRDLDVEVNRLRGIFGENFGAIEAFLIAASPKSDAAARGTGVPELLEFCLQSSVQVTDAMPRLPPADRVFDRIVSTKR